VSFFFDNNLAPKLAKSLHVLVEPEHQIVHLKDRFTANNTGRNLDDAARE